MSSFRLGSEEAEKEDTISEIIDFGTSKLKTAAK